LYCLRVYLSPDEMWLTHRDGLHLSTKGYAVFWQEYCKLVKGPLKGRGLDWTDPADCPPRVPMCVCRLSIPLVIRLTRPA
jgi:hypothetical protein